MKLLGPLLLLFSFSLAHGQVHTGCPTCPGGKAYQDLEAANKSVEAIKQGLIEVKKKEQNLLDHVWELYAKCEVKEAKSKDIVELLVYFNALKLNDGTTECASRNQKLNCLLNKKIRKELKKFSKSPFVDEYLQREHKHSKEEAQTTIKSIESFGKKKD